MPRKGPIAAAALAGALLMPAGALGSNAQVSTDTLLYFATAGETNNVTVTRVGANFVVTDTGSTITPGTGCAAVNANTVNCAAAAISDLDLRAGDLNDTIAVDASVTGLGDPDGSFPKGAVLQGDGGNDTLTGGPAITNSIFGASTSGGDSAGTDTLTGGALNDDLSGSDDADVLTGGEGFDQLDPGGGADTATGGPQTDFFTTEATPDGADAMDGGAGTDSLSYDSRTVPIAADSDAVADDGAGCPGGGCEGDNVIDIESIQGGGGGDVLTGTEQFDSLFGAGGSDIVAGVGGNDQLAGGVGDDQVSGGEGKDFIFNDDGNDVYDGGGGADEFSPGSESGATPGSDRDAYIGGPGDDLIDFEFGEVAIGISLDDVPDDGVGCPGAACEGDNVGSDVELVIGSERADTLIGSDAANEIEGAGGNDVIVGGGGADGLDGAAGDDRIDAGAGVDALDGGSGADSLRSRDRDRDQVDCGSSIDSVLADSKDEPEASCDQTSEGLVIDPKAKASGPVLALKLTCPAAEGIDCKAKLKLSKGKRTVGSAKAKIKSGKTKTLKLKPKGLGDSASLEASASFKDAAGEKVTSRRRVRVS